MAARPNMQTCSAPPGEVAHQAAAPPVQQQAWLWGDTSLSDTVLRLVQCGGTTDVPEVLVEMPVHSAVLGTASEYFRAALLRLADSDTDTQPLKKICLRGARTLGWAPPASSTASGRVITENVHKGQLEVAKALVKFMYTGILECDSVDDLMQAACLADRWQVGSAVTASLQHILSLPVLTATDMAHILKDVLPYSLTRHSVFAEVQALCQQHLLRLFGKLPVMLKEPELLAEFCRLSFAAVKLWLGLDELQIDSENSVVVAISHWWLARDAVPLPDAAKVQLSELVRLNQLSTSFLFLVLPQLPWWHCDPERLRNFHMVRAMFGAEASIPTAAMKLLPAAWCKPTRAKSADPGAQMTFVWEVSQEELTELHDKAGSSPGGANLASPGWYWAGYLWHLSLLRKDPREPLWVGVTCSSALPAAFNTPKLVQASFKISCMEERTQAYTRTESISFRLMAPAKVNGTKTLLMGKDATQSGPVLSPNLLPNCKLCLLLELESMQ